MKERKQKEKKERKNGCKCTEHESTHHKIIGLEERQTNTAQSQEKHPKKKVDRIGEEKNKENIVYKYSFQYVTQLTRTQIP